jgi:hypothetical protein
MWRRTGSVLLRFVTRLGQGGGQLLRRQALERAEIGLGQGGALEVAQQGSAFTAAFDFFFTTGIAQLTAALELIGRHLAVLIAELARRLAIQVKAVRGLADGDQVGRGPGVATQKGRQGLFAELARGALLNVCLDAQLQGLGLAREQGWEQGRQSGPCFGRRDD